LDTGHDGHRQRSTRDRVSTTPSAHAHTAPRVIFVDLARAGATLLMLEGHTIDALLSDAYRGTTGFLIWTFIRGLTSVLFMLVSGFTFSLTTIRGEVFKTTGPATARRMRRFLLLTVIGFALHFPSRRLWNIPVFTSEQWHRFLAVDVLQCIAMMLAVLQLTAILTRNSRRFLIAVGGICAAVVCLTPFVWRTTWEGSVPLILAGYLSPSATGSQFPLFPWMAYGVLGAGMGTLYGRLGAGGRQQPTAGAAALFVTASSILLLSAYLVAHAPWQPLGPTDFWTTSPGQFLMRSGLACALLAGVAFASRGWNRRVEAIESLAQSALAVYVIHVCLVYGSPWNRGLRQLVGPTQSPFEGALWVLGMWSAMTLLAWTWHRCRREYPRVAVVVRYASAAGLVYALL
jgi:uncharacterized membrane protein